MSNRILIDGQNILRHGDGTIKLSNLKILRRWAEENRIEILIVLPSYNKYRDMVPKSSDIHFINSYVYDDSALIQIAVNYNLPILSNDKFREYREIYPEYDFDFQVFSFDIILGMLITNYIETLRTVHRADVHPIETYRFQGV